MSDKELLIGTLLIDNGYGDELRDGYIAQCDKEDEAKQPHQRFRNADGELDNRVLAIALDEVELMKRYLKDQAKPEPVYVIPQRDSLGILGAANLLRKAGLEPKDETGLPF